MTKKKSGPNNPRGMVGCGTPEIMFQASARTKLGNLPGVVGLKFAGQRIIVEVSSEEAGEALPKTFRRRRVQYVVVKPGDRPDGVGTAPRVHPTECRCEAHASFHPAPSQLPLDICPACNQLKLIAPFKICKSCSLALGQCEVCLAPAGGTPKTSLVARYFALLTRHRSPGHPTVVAFREAYGRNLTFKENARVLDKLLDTRHARK